MQEARVLIMDDEEKERKRIEQYLARKGHDVLGVGTVEEAVDAIRRERFDAFLTDCNIPGVDALKTSSEARKINPDMAVIIMTAFGTIETAVKAIKAGAYDYLPKPIDLDQLALLIERISERQNLIRENTELKEQLRERYKFKEIVSTSQAMEDALNMAGRVAGSTATVLLRGESGTGKELVAQALHFNGPRKDNRFVTINCSAIPETLIESEFFGHEKGAFTGADSRKIGKFQYADGGTLFLDEIGDITAGMQVKLLRVLQEKKFTPVGANREVEVNVRIVAATNRHLEEMVKKGEFREDLFYRLNVLPIQLPTLRERKNDIDALVTYFIEKFNQQHKKNVTGLSPEAMELVKAHNWPGNIRELENVIEHAFVIESGNTIMPASLPSSITRIGRPGLDDDEDELSAGNGDLDQDDGDDLMAAISVSTGGLSPLNVGGKGFTLDINRLDFQANKEEFERQFLISALTAFKGRINQTALHANIPKKTLLRKLQKYGITAKDYSGRIT
ncbi:MAG TPA: sigma-54-dependent Fis family transcriptional regulator [Bdellovibrionales bacterium]|nr:sigma-54-dependent Fis family transcriptional regulator [Bdellovibrionales bacterium]